VTDVLAFLATNRSIQTDDFDRDRAAAQATSDTIARMLLATLSTLPAPSSSSSFVYRLNPTLGTEERQTASFGPAFVQRALTAGAHQGAVAVTIQHLHFNSLDGRNLRDGSLVTVANQFTDESAPFDVDRLTLNVNASIATLYGSFGAAERLEIGFAAPVVMLRIEGSRVNTYRGSTFTQATASATALGLADVLVNGKYLLYDRDGARLAAAAAVRLPTGRRDDLLGSGSRSLNVTAVGSLEGRSVSTHANIGYTFGGISRELGYGFATAVAVTPRVTTSAELTGRWVYGAGQLVTSSAPHPRLVGVDTLRLLSTNTGANIVSVAPGMKWNVGGTWVVAANVALALTHAGLVSPVTPFVGFDYTF
jgi:hypothetical protein